MYYYKSKFSNSNRIALQSYRNVILLKCIANINVKNKIVWFIVVV